MRGFLMLLAMCLVLGRVASFAATAPVTVSPASLGFSSQVIGASTTKSITLTNNQTVILANINITISGADYTQTNTCGSQLAAKGKCTISVTFAPKVGGAHPGTVSVADNASNSPLSVTLSGTGVKAATLSASLLNYGLQIVGTTSASKPLTLTNNQKIFLNISSISTSGDYAQTNDCGAGLNPSGTCVINVRFSPTATGTRLGLLTVTDDANNSPQTTNLTGNGQAPKLLSITLTPSSATIAKGQSQQFVAMGDYNNGTSQPLNSGITWKSSAPSVATVNKGLASSHAKGVTSISATSGQITGSAGLTVGPPAVVSLTISPAGSSIPLGTTEQFSVSGTYSDGTNQTLTNLVSWASSVPIVATISGSGLAGSIATGSSSISAQLGSVSASTTLTVTPPTLMSIAVSPASSSIALGTSEQLKATGQYGDGSTLDLTNSVTWNSAPGGAVAVSAVGLASGKSVGSTTVNAALGLVTGSAMVNVTPAVLVSISVSPAIPAISLGASQQFDATGSFSDGTTQQLTAAVQWNSDAAAIATIGTGSDSPGLAVSVGAGSTNISATQGAISGSTTLSVTAPTLVSISVTPANASIPRGTQQQFSATGRFTDGSTPDLTTSVTWSSDTNSSVSISASGLASGVNAGTATISATIGTTAGTTVLSVTPATLVSISIGPQTPSIPLGTNQQFTATGTYTDGTTQDVGGLVHWSAGDGTVATVSNSPPTQGVASSVAQGNVVVTASLSGINGSATLAVTAASLTSIAVSPAVPVLSIGGSLQFTATGTFSDHTLRDLTSLAQWSAGEGTVAVMTGPLPGVANAVGVGSVFVVATFNGLSASAILTVTPAMLMSIAVTPAQSTLADGLDLQFTATGAFSDGTFQDLTAMAQWSAGNDTIAIVSNSAPTQGVATAVGPGTVTLTALCNGITGSATMTVTPAALVFVTMSPATATILPGAGLQFSLLGTFTDDTAQDLTNTAGWSSSVPATASVGLGLATGLTPGTTLISATYGSLSASAQLNVTSSAPVLVSLQVSPSGSTMAVEATQQFVALGTFSDSTTQDLTTSATWSSSDDAVVSIQSAGQSSPGLGVATGAGSATVTAVLSGVTASITVLVESNAVRIPLMDISGSQNYLGFAGGLYENSSNTAPADHDSAGLAAAAQVRPLDRLGNASASGAEVFLAIGMSNALSEFNTFQSQAATSLGVNHQTLAIENGAFGSDTACFWTVANGPATTACPSGTGPLAGNQYDRVRDTILATASTAPSAPSGCGGPPNPVPCLTEQQVQVLWIKNANSQPGVKFRTLCDTSATGCVNDINTEAIRYESQLGKIVRAAHSRYPNLREIFISSRIYAGYATSNLNPEPYAYEYGYSVKWLIEAQVVQERTGTVDPIAGDLSYDNASTAWLAWGPYMWADGVNPRTDGLQWLKTDFQNSDFTHPNVTGQAKVSNQLMNFLMTSPYTHWFLSQ